MMFELKYLQWVNSASKGNCICLINLNSLNIKPILYYRYVDDIIISAPEEEIHDILRKFNCYHHRLKLTLETEANRCLNFLDLSLKVEKK